MSSIRQNKIEGVILEELSTYFQRNAREVCLGAMVSAGPDKKEVLESIQSFTKKIRGEVGKRLKNMRKIPELLFYIDDSIDYASQIDALLKKK
ncbi:MAG: ribosome-binding factor A [Fluviicola sp.]|nr:ribosome-binding factor A [Fluviicola sp.]